MATACEKCGRRPNTWVTKIEEFARWNRWDNWQNVAVRNRALWEQSMLEFIQFAVGIEMAVSSHICPCAQNGLAIGVQA